MRKVLLPVLSVLVLALAFGGAAWADTALHGVCNGTGGSTCTDIGFTPLGNSTTYGFTISSGPDNGDLVIDILLPNNYTLPASGFAITPTVSATLVSSTQWTSGKLATYLATVDPADAGFLGATPSNPFANYIGTTTTLDPGATGFYVFQANLGVVTIPGQGSGSTGNLSFPLTGLGNDLGAFILGFCTSGCPSAVDATANSGALLVTPEPGSLTMLFAGLLGLALLAGRRVLGV